MSEHRGFASLLWSHTQCFTHTPWHSTAVTPFLAFQQSSAVEALSRGLHKLGLCFYPGENSRSLYYNLPADWSDGCASTAAVQGTLEQGSHLTLCAEMVLLSVGWQVIVCASSRKDLCSCCCCSERASPPNECLFTSSVSLSWFLAGCPPAPSPPTSTLAHFFHSFLSTPSLATSHFSPSAPSSIRVGSVLLPQQGESPPLDTLQQHFRKCCCLSVRVQSKTIIPFLWFIFITWML